MSLSCNFLIRSAHWKIIGHNKSYASGITYLCHDYNTEIGNSSFNLWILVTPSRYYLSTFFFLFYLSRFDFFFFFFKLKHDCFVFLVSYFSLEICMSVSLYKIFTGIRDGSLFKQDNILLIRPLEIISNFFKSSQMTSLHITLYIYIFKCLSDSGHASSIALFTKR